MYFWFSICLFSFVTMRICSFFLLLCLFRLFSRAGALYGYGWLRCQFTSPDDAVYLEQIYFNKMLMAQFNSTLGHFTGYTKRAKEITDVLNKNTSILKQSRKNAEKCKSQLALALDLLLKPVEPYVKLRSVKAPDSKHPGMLVCSLYNFYPKQIQVTWLRNGTEVTSDVTSTEELPNGNWYYQIHSYLEYTPRPGEKITCMVKHASLKEPKLYDWDPRPESQTNKIAVGTAGLLLGLVFLGAGLIYFKKNAAGRVLVPTS